jgi:hypothetical protein
VDGTSLAVGVNGGIVAIQNMQESIGTTMLCGGQLLHVNGRNPLASILTAIGGVVGGLGKSHSGHCGTPTTYTVTIPDGLYEISQINSYLQFQMIKNGTYLINSVGQYVYYLEIVLSPTAYGVQINTYPVPTSSGWTQNGTTGQWTGNAGTAFAGWTTPLANTQAGNAGWVGFPTTIFNPVFATIVGNYFNNIIGYASGFSTSVNTGNNTNLSYLSTTAPEVNPNAVAYVAISNISNPYANPSSIIYSISPDVAFGQLITELPPQFCWSPLLQGTYNQLRLQFLGTDFAPLKILDPVMTIMLVIRDRKEGYGYDGKS